MPSKMPVSPTGQIVISPKTGSPALWFSGPSHAARILELDGTIVQVSVSSNDAESQSGNSPMDFFVPVDQCPLCRTPTAKSRCLGVVQQLFWKVPIHVCGSCGLAYKLAQPNGRMANVIYAHDYSHFCDAEEVTASTDPPMDHRTLRLGRPDGRRHLDVGCGVGHFVSASRAAGFDSMGVDPFLPNVHGPNAKYLVRGDICDAEMRQSLRQFDVITLWAVWEHLADPITTIRAAAGMLRAGGLLLLNSPNGYSPHVRFRASTWSMATLLEHVTFLTPAACRYLVEELSLVLERLRHCGSPFPIGTGAIGVDGQGLTSSMQRRLFGFRATDEQPRAASASVGNGNQAGWRARLIVSANSPVIAAIVRNLLAATRIGDHIEVYLRAR